MPTATYEDLLTETCPQIIETRKQYQTIGQRFGDLLAKGRARTAEETKLMRLLGLLIQDYDRRHAMAPDDSTAAERLQFLLEHSGKTSADLSPALGKRAISAPQARKLGALFHVHPGLFL